MLIDETSLQHWIDYFYGYGSWHAPVWFIAYEEGGGDLPEEVAEKVDYFYQSHVNVTAPTLCDIRELYQRVTIRFEGPKAAAFANFYEYRFGRQAVQHRVWKNLMDFEYSYRNEELPGHLAYQQNSFASSSAPVEALIRLYPLPSSHNHAWYYSWLDAPSLPFLKSRALYEQYLYQRRMNNILQNIRQYKPDLVLMYGMNNINLIKKSVQDFFPSAMFRMIKAVKQQTPQHHRANLDGTTLLITTQIPALRHNRIETGFNWSEFGRSVNTKQ